MIENRVLKRQLKKLKIDENESISKEQLKKLLEFVELTYNDMDNNVYRLERALDVSTTELRNLNDNLEERIHQEVIKNREKDDKLLIQSRFASMGEMIGNIAHQWRQPLSAISSTSSGMLLQLSLDIADKRDFEKSYNDILGYTQFLSQTIDDFRNFLNQTNEKCEFNIVDTINSALSIVSSVYEHNSININYFNKDKSNKIMTLGFPSKLSQVFLNIFNNAKDALVSKNSPNNRKIFIGYIDNKDNHTIFIQDNAGGIPENIIEKIFDPYFTTKHQSQGTGIGLYMSRKIVEAIGGEVTVRNQKLQIEENYYDGACFFIDLPKLQK